MEKSGETDERRGQKKPESAWKYAHLGIQLGMIFLAFFGIGFWIDGRYSTSPWFTLGGTFVGFAIGMYYLIRTVR